MLFNYPKSFNMQFVSEEIIEQVIDSYYSQDNKYEKDQEVFEKEQPCYIALLADEGFEILTDDEYELLWFNATIIYSAAKIIQPNIAEFEQEKIEDFDEKNWEVLERNVTGTFRDRVTPFFQDYPQEDLLAFVEDSLESDEDVVITSTGRELIFVACKTLIDCLC
jgi:hypothetical protein